MVDRYVYREGVQEAIYIRGTNSAIISMENACGELNSLFDLLMYHEEVNMELFGVLLSWIDKNITPDNRVLLEKLTHDMVVANDRICDVHYWRVLQED